MEGSPGGTWAKPTFLQEEALDLFQRLLWLSKSPCEVQFCGV